MNCSESQQLLVAFADNELSKSEALMVKAHLSSCEICREQEQALRELVLTAVEIPAHWEARMQDAVNIEAVLAAARRTKRRGSVSSWIWGGAEVPVVAVIAYASILVLVLSWGMQRHFAASTLEARYAPDAALSTDIGVTGDHYKPASYSPVENGTTEGEQTW